jgi:hypothetical protein
VITQDMEDTINVELADAERENRNIYMQLVPANLPPVEARKMVQPKDAKEVLDRNDEWFADIVPDRVMRHLSRCLPAPSLLLLEL